MGKGKREAGWLEGGSPCSGWGFLLCPHLAPSGPWTVLCTTWAQRRQGQQERKGLPRGASSLSAFKAEDPASFMPFFVGFLFPHSPLGLFIPPSTLTPETLLSHTTYGAFPVPDLSMAPM